MPKLTMLVGPPGSGKTTKAHEIESKFGRSGEERFYRVSQDDQGKNDHLELFKLFLSNRENIIIDRMNFNKVQRDRYLAPAKAAGYETEIIVLHESYDTCLARCLKRLKREGHPTIKDEANARSALATFFGKYERVQDNEADKVTRIWPEGAKDEVVICDLDGTLCNIDHRLHFVRKVEGKRPDWKNFFYNIPGDSVNKWCDVILEGVENFGFDVIYCSGRPDTYREITKNWLGDNRLNREHLFMRPRNDSRQDNIVKEVILDFEILTRWKPLFAIDDRKQVVDMWRSRGITCLQCAEGNF